MSKGNRDFYVLVILPIILALIFVFFTWFSNPLKILENYALNSNSNKENKELKLNDPPPRHSVRGRIIRTQNPEEEKKVVHEKQALLAVMAAGSPEISVSEEKIAEDLQEEKKALVTFDLRPPEELLDEARRILISKTGPYDQAFDDLRSIILMQPPEKARDAHELLGYAYEKSKYFEKAKIEYGIYLALYKQDDDDRTRVRQRLMALEILNPTQEIRVGPGQKARPREGDSLEFSGTFSEYLYMSSTSQSAAIAQWKPDQIDSLTGAQFTITKQHNEYTITSKVRFTELKDFSNSLGNRTNLSAAYVDFADTFKHYNIRLGRQFPAAGAVSRFDGISAMYPLNDSTNVSVAAGVPFVGQSETKRKFVGVQVDKNFNDAWRFGVYTNRQLADSLLERLALGTEVQYRDKKTTASAKAEYDTVYHTLNQFSLQGLTYIGDYDLFGFYERRRSPMPYGDIALSVGILNPERRAYNSINELVSQSGLSPSQIYNYISSTTPISNSFVLGVTKKINNNWSITSDVQSTNLTTTPTFTLTSQFDPVPIQVGQKNNYSLNFHLRGDNFIVKDNTAEFVIDETIGARKSKFATFADSYRFGDQNTNVFSLIARYDSFDQMFGKTNTFSGTIRLLYGVGQHGMLESQYSRSLTLQPSQNQLNTNQTFYIGYRYDF